MACLELLEAAKAVLVYLQLSGEPTASDLMYRTPAMAMREAADALDRKDAAIRKFREAVEKCEREERDSRLQ